ncbi:hypothetical protein KFL_002870150 [Klebsormidium nitens]|uniref:Uncharacterized protein n=1 Tax=Klebsormidium nitens TaxID=105231 RepID=A0A1Y1IBB0_KLENI|nr:hypothetical protein KFL_002870150 [Klebsormidium nitens]|eukprot:GAQ86411.1 hypothetical protein KFL_002870150 [Klebsormidium nitens]
MCVSISLPPTAWASASEQSRPIWFVLPYGFFSTNDWRRQTITRNKVRRFRCAKGVQAFLSSWRRGHVQRLPVKRSRAGSADVIAFENHTVSGCNDTPTSVFNLQGLRIFNQIPNL